MLAKTQKAGGVARAAKLSPDQRREIAVAAAQARWSKRAEPKPEWLSAELWAFVEARALKRKITPYAWIARCIDKARLEIDGGWSDAKKP